MKLVRSLLVAALVAAPAVSFAQSQSQPQHGLTRAEVRAELVQLEKAGYNPASDNTQYPQNIEAAEARISAAHDTAAYGGVANGSSAAGAPVVGLGSIYAHS
jgi:hypothetical protein